MKEQIDIFNKHAFKKYNFKKVNDHLYIAKIKDLGAYEMVVDYAILVAYNHPDLEGTIFEMVWRFNGKHFSSAIVGRVVDGKFEKFSLETFPDSVTIIPDNKLEDLNQKITDAIKSK